MRTRRADSASMTPDPPVPPPASPPRAAHNSARMAQFLAKFRATIIVLSGEAEGMEHVLDQPRVLIGRGPGVDLSLEDSTLERVHASLWFDGTGYRLENLAQAGSSELKEGSRFCLGQVAFEYVLEPRVFPIL